MLRAFQSLTLDETHLFYSGSVADIRALLGSGDEAVMAALKQHGHAYRRFHNRTAYDVVVAELLTNGKSRSPIRYEVIAQIMRLRGTKLLTATILAYPSAVTMPGVTASATPLLKALFGWRDLLSGTLPASYRTESFIGSSYLLAAELPVAVEALEQLQLSDLPDKNTQQQYDNMTATLLPLLRTINEAGQDLLVVHGGYAPKRSKLDRW